MTADEKNREMADSLPQIAGSNADSRKLKSQTAGDRKVLLCTEHLVKEFPIGGTKKNPLVVHAVSDVNLEIYEGETLALVGESGCGKSTLGRLLLGLLPPTQGQVFFDGRDLAACSPRDLRALRRQMQMVFQDTAASLNPRLTVEGILAEPLRVHRLCPRREIPARAAVLLDQVGLPRDLLGRYPHALSGGQRQRVGIAQALLGDPEVVILDEPTVGLDPKQIMEIRALIQSLGKDHTVILSSHILSEVQAVCQTILILSKGRLVACDTPENLEKRFAGTTTVELTAEATAEEVRAILAPLDHILEVTTREEPRGRCGVVLETDGEDALCREIFFAFSRAQKALLRMTTAQTSLEEIFLELTAEAPVVQLPGEGQRQDGEEAEG